MIFFEWFFNELIVFYPSSDTKLRIVRSKNPKCSYMEISETMKLWLEAGKVALKIWRRITAVADKGPYGTSYMCGSASGDEVSSEAHLPCPEKREMADPLELVRICNRKPKYGALIIGLEILLDMHVTTVHISGDSQLVIKQLNGEFKCNAPGLEMYFSIASYLLTKFDDVTITHVPKIDNGNANVMAQLASGLKVPDGINEQWVKISKQLPLIGDRDGQLEMINPVDTVQDDWRTPIIQYLQNPQLRVNTKMKLQAIKYFILDGDLFKRTPEGLTLRCLG
ncbi:hypothetical protein RJ640_000505 [Escallonia rubra]|uniref:RNase H type-1 domain-containing protein n=1 Tax=Escallonia rubra TaxID=112253 RepID=A0AA88SNK4_9ASTE|nr:hypothetical protein RJ640_000505 [Escallonia rubra]